MTQKPKLTVCVPSRNRQPYFQETIRSLLENGRGDVEFVFADNSTDAAIMVDFMAARPRDDRVVFLPSEATTLSMADNWERCIEISTGEFVCVIGDDDFIDVNLVDLIVRCQEQCGADAVDTLQWNKIYYNWPDNREFPGNIDLSAGLTLHRVPAKRMQYEFFSWRPRRPSPDCAFSIYHGVVSRRLMDRMKARYGGRYFEYPVVDFENVCKLLMTTESLFFSERSLSVLGSCAKSNSARGYTVEKVAEQHAQFMAESGRNIDEDDHMKDFPFPSILGMAACVAQTQHWFLNKYGYAPIEGWEKNFVIACGVNTNSMSDPDSYNAMVEGYRAAFASWQGGRHLPDYSPLPFIDRANMRMFTGVRDGRIYLDENIGDAQTPAALYGIVDGILGALDQIELKFEQQARAA